MQEQEVTLRIDTHSRIEGILEVRHHINKKEHASSDPDQEVMIEAEEALHPIQTEETHTIHHRDNKPGTSMDKDGTNLDQLGIHMQGDRKLARKARMIYVF